jgi:hypothetical protein
MRFFGSEPGHRALIAIDVSCGPGNGKIVAGILSADSSFFGMTERRYSPAARLRSASSAVKRRIGSENLQHQRVPSFREPHLPFTIEGRLLTAPQ